MTTVRRVRQLTERAWFWVPLTLLLAVGITAASYLGIRYLQDKYAGDGGAAFALIVGLGVVALLLILTTFFYQIRKRLLQESVGGTMMSWLKSHVYLGLLALVAAVAHAAIFPLTTDVTSGKITGAILVLLVLSGILWRIVYVGVPPRVAGDVGNLAVRMTREQLAIKQMELEKLKAGKSPAFHRMVGDLASGTRRGADVDKDLPQLSLQEQQDWAVARSLVEQIEGGAVRERKQKRYSRIMQGWKAIHLPLAALLLGSIGYHLYDVFNVDRFLASEPARQFASSKDCARCHSEIVDEWKLSMHRNAQTSTTTVAQSQFALQKYPDFKKICVNCHAPIGVLFSQKASFPLTDEDPRDDPQRVEDEGVTCIVCHTMPHPPEEIQGAGELPLPKRSATSLGLMFGPPLSNPEQIPNTAHDTAVGFMNTSASASQMCAACHNVKADIDGDGIVAPQFATSTASAKPVDTDGDGQLDENELDFQPPEVLAQQPLGFVGLQDLALQTTYDEWEDYMFAKEGKGASCVDCHMPASKPGPIIDNPPPGLEAADRRHQKHYFVAVDYELNDSYYTREGMPEDAMQHVLEDREAFLAQTAQVSVTAQAPAPDGRLTAQVNINSFEGHSFPTGFAFARQFWLEVSAKTASGKPVCLVPDPHGINSPCESGKISTPTENLATCDPAASGLGNKEIRFTVVSPLDKCDPWLVNWQKILTDGDADGDGIFSEVAHQSLKPDIVKLRVRTADQKVVAPISSGGTATFDYIFDASQAAGEPIEVRAVLRMRHLPPYFIEGLSDYLPDDLPASELLENMTVVNIASNLPLASPRTDPAPTKFSDETLASRGSRAAGVQADRSGIAFPMTLGAAIAASLAWMRRRRSS